MAKCVACDGTGVVVVVQPGTGKSIEISCPACRGSGKI